MKLLADIGGTHARFALARAHGAPFSQQTLEVAAFKDPISACRHYLRSVGEPRVSEAAWALACPVLGDRVRLTNAGWVFDRIRLQQALDLKRLILLNDFEALAWSLPGLTRSDGYALGRGRPVAGAPLALLGPGTGLGVSGLVPTPEGRWTALSGEGGHVSLAPGNRREAEILELIWQRHDHVSAERVLSGSGLPLLLSAVAQVDQITGQKPPDDYHNAAVISAAAIQGDPLANATLKTFWDMLGSVAGNLALTLGARGGVYVGGGLAIHLGVFLRRSSFRDRFEQKGRFSGYLRKIPTYVITAHTPALTGALISLGR